MIPESVWMKWKSSVPKGIWVATTTEHSDRVGLLYELYETPGNCYVQFGAGGPMEVIAFSFLRFATNKEITDKTGQSALERDPRNIFKTY